MADLQRQEETRPDYQSFAARGGAAIQLAGMRYDALIFRRRVDRLHRRAD
jgi:hypothetical protein